MSAVLDIARAWIGTPYVVGAARRGVGCDCVGLLRGVWAEATGRPDPGVPGWRPDWAGDWTRPLIRALAEHCTPVPVAEAVAGDLVVIAMRRGGVAHHCGVLGARRRIVHSTERAGVIEAPLGALHARIVAAGRVV